MRILIAEDELISRKFLYKFLSYYGDCDITINGVEALDAYMLAVDEQKPYELICLDIMMPEMDGVTVLKTIRKLEEANKVEKDKRVKIIMTTALQDTKSVYDAFDLGCEAYAAKPIDIDKMQEVIKKLGLIQ